MPCLLSQYRASIFNTAAIDKNFEPAVSNGSGIVCFSPLAQGLLTDKYLNGIPDNSRAARESGYLKVSDVTEARVKAARMLNEIASARGISLAEMALAWLLADGRVTSVIVGASSVAQLQKNLKAINLPAFSSDEMNSISSIASHPGVQFQ